MIKIISILTVLLFGVTACSSSEQAHFTDLDKFLKIAQKKPQKKEKADEEFAQYKSFTYSALKLRSPFEIPKLFIPPAATSVISSIKPDMSRVRQPLETFNLEQLKMVGNVTDSGIKWGLVRANGSIYRVKTGDYLGKNHGMIRAIKDDRIDIIELIPMGTETWIERSATLTMTME